MPAGGIDEQTDDRIQDHCAGSAHQRRGQGGGRQSTKALAEPPDGKRPAKGDEQRGLDRLLAEDQSKPDRALDLGGERVPQCEVVPIEVVDHFHRAAHNRPLVFCRRREDFGDDAVRVHEALELEQTYKQPDHAECDLDATCRDDRRSRGSSIVGKRLGGLCRTSVERGAHDDGASACTHARL